MNTGIKGSRVELEGLRVETRTAPDSDAWSQLVRSSVLVYVLSGEIIFTFSATKACLQPGQAAVVAGTRELGGYGNILLVDAPSALGRLDETSAAAVLRADAANHYRWGAGCDGWKLLELPGLSVREERMPPGTSEISHIHDGAQQVFFGLSGEPVMALPEGERGMPPFTMVAVRAGTPHQMRNRGPDTARFLAISAPGTAVDRIQVDEALVARPGSEPA